MNRFVAKPVLESDIVWTYAGVRPLYDDGSDNPSEITRDYVLKVDHDNGELPLLSIFGGKITTYRRLAEHALQELKPFYPAMKNGWTATVPLPGGDIESVTLTTQMMTKKYPALPVDFLKRLVMRHGSRAEGVLKGVTKMSDLGTTFGQGANLLCEREIEFFIREEWARKADDILWRRTKCGLHMDAAERARASKFMEDAIARVIGKK